MRDELLRGGQHPGLSPDVFRAGWHASKRQQAGAGAWGDPVVYRLSDGMTDRAQRYQRELDEGRWALPDSWADAPPPPAPPVPWLAAVSRGSVSADHNGTLRGRKGRAGQPGVGTAKTH